MATCPIKKIQPKLFVLDITPVKKILTLFEMMEFNNKFYLQ